MKLHRVVPAALAALVILPALASAQQVRTATTVYSVAQRGFIGVLTEEVRATSGAARQRAVMDVVPGSPAEKAGVVKGDTIVRINGAAATAAVMAMPFEPGDSITLRVRRNGRERDVRLVAGERQATYSRQLIPTEVNDRIQVIQGRIALMADTATVPRLFIQRINGDSQIVVFGTDTIRALRGTLALTIDSLHSTMLRLPHDSVFATLQGRAAGVSIFRAAPDSNIVMFRPAEIATGTFAYGMRAVAGAELFDLNPELGASFGVQRGVVVLDAREGTPAARAGLRGGDVIIRANGTEIGSITELRRAIDATRAGTPVQLRVMRRGQTVDVTLNR